jgi:hypothetical protein
MTDDPTTDDADESTEYQGGQPATQPSRGDDQPAQQSQHGRSGHAGRTRGAQRHEWPDPDDRKGLFDRDPKALVYWVGLAAFGLLALVALAQFYSSASAAITTFVTERWRPVVQAAFSLSVLIASLVGVSLTVRELSEA